MGLRPRRFRPRYAGANLGHPSYPFDRFLEIQSFSLRTSLQLHPSLSRLADVFVPVFQVFLYFGHELAGVGSVDDAVIEAQGQTDDAVNGDGIGPVFIGNYGWFLTESADP